MYPRVDFFVGIFLVIFSAAAHYMAGKLPEAQRGIGPGDYPQVILKALFVLGLIEIGYAYYLYRKKSAAGVRKFEKRELLNVLILALTVVAYTRLVTYVGFILLTPFFLFAMMFIFGQRQWIKMTVVSVVSTAVIYLLFNNLLLVLLPRFRLF